MKLYANDVSWIFGLILLQLSIRKISSNTANDDDKPDCINTLCRCTEASKTVGESKIICENVTDSIDIREELKYIWKNTPTRELELRNSNIENLPASMFRNLSFTGIIFRNNTVEKIDKLLFQDSRNTATFTLFFNNNFGAEFNIKFLQSLRVLHYVEFSGNNLLSISDEVFGDLPVLQSIYIRNNNLVKIGKRSFASLPHLVRLYLERNEIEKLKENMFNTSENLESVYLDLSYNQIQEIEPNAFAGLKANYISLEHNKLTTLTQAAFEPLLDSMLSHDKPRIHLWGNPFDCDLSIAWLVEKPAEYREMVKGCPCI